MPQKFFEMIEFDIGYRLLGGVKENEKKASMMEMLAKSLDLKLIGGEVLGVLYSASAGRASN
jgi:hypothetical protein